MRSDHSFVLSGIVGVNREMPGMAFAGRRMDAV